MPNVNKGRKALIFALSWVRLSQVNITNTAGYKANSISSMSSSPSATAPSQTRLTTLSPPAFIRSLSSGEQSLTDTASTDFLRPGTLPAWPPSSPPLLLSAASAGVAIGSPSLLIFKRGRPSPARGAGVAEPCCASAYAACQRSCALTLQRDGRGGTGIASP